MEHFQELNSPSNTTSYNDHDNNGPEYDSTPLNDLFTEQEVRKQISKLKNGKSSGIDVILNEFLKNSPTSMVTLLVKFFNLILTTGLTPTEWSIGIIVPIYKNKGSQNDPGSYRGITLLSCMGKLFTALLNQRLNAYLEVNEILGEEQAGFRNQYSTIDHSLTLHLVIDLLLSRKERLYGI